MRTSIIYLLFVILLAGCRDNYELPLRNTDVSLLVVEGVLNAGQGSTTITLSRTLVVEDATTFKPELRASLSVEGKDGGSFALAETGNGNYTHAQLPLVIGQEYRLRIQTADNKIYLSDYIVARQTPAIDSISWKKGEEGLVIYANTHDASNNTRYYKWDYDETWEIRSYYTAFYKWVQNVSIIYSPVYNNRCWKRANSGTIILGSTAQLTSDVVKDAPLLSIPMFSDKLSVRYSILLRQQSLTKDAYEYLKLMKANTETIGSIFDPQPAELKGNIKCITNPEEGVIGYLTAANITEKRIFITADEADWQYIESCETIKVPNHPDSLIKWVPVYLPYDADLELTGISYYHMAKASCVDCTTRGGNLDKPSYW